MKIRKLPKGLVEEGLEIRKKRDGYYVYWHDPSYSPLVYGPFDYLEDAFDWAEYLYYWSALD